MPSGILRSPSLAVQPQLPVWIRWVDGLPKILAGGVPIVPFNTALRYRARQDGATRKSLAAYARAGALYTTYCAHKGVSLLDIANDEFPSFVDGLLGLKFRNAGEEFVHLDGRARSRSSADLYLALLHSLTGDVAPVRRLVRLAPLPEGSRRQRGPHSCGSRTPVDWIGAACAPHPPHGEEGSGSAGPGV